MKARHGQSRSCSVESRLRPKGQRWSRGGHGLTGRSSGRAGPAMTRHWSILELLLGGFVSDGMYLTPTALKARRVRLFGAGGAQ